ncbi:protein kinase [Streptomyces sp. NPDC102406]|uniref:serine/threonine-protein kinase n=1 Tax=Streptomyces sp. NPDC102406 TaxID=3366171 RepID=UPI003807DCE0
MGPYVTLARLGAGGMGEVFLARPERLAAGYGPDDLVAVKVIRNEAARDEAYLRRFRREAAVAAAVTSPNVARLVAGSVDGDAGTMWLATEYVGGPTLGQAVGRHGPLPAGAVARLGEGMARALSAVHAAGALHRDLKPANVLLGADGPKVIDFGVARLRAATTLTSTGRMVGTPAYMSPEHIAGGRHVVAASDVFCLASVLAYAATGVDLFGEGPLAAVLFRVAQAEPPLDAVPGALRPLLAACLAKEPGARPGADELVERFAALRPGFGGPGDAWPEPVTRAVADADREVRRLCATGAPLLPLPPAPPQPAGPGLGAGTLAPHQFPTMGPTPPPAAPPAAPRRGRARALAVVAALAVAGAGVGVFLALRGQDGGDEAGAGGVTAAPGPTTTLDPAQLRARAGVDAAGLNDRSGYVPQFPAQRADGWRPWTGRLGHAPMGCSADTRAVVCLRTDGTYQALSATDGHPLWTSRGAPGASGDVEEAYIGPSGTLFMPGDAVAPQSRGGRTAVASHGELRLLDSGTGRVRWKAEPPPGRGQFSAPALLTDDTVIATVGGVSLAAEPAGASLRAYDIEDGSVRWDLPLAGAARGQSDDYRFGARALVDGVVYAQTPEGISAVDARDGDVLGRAAVSAPGGCRLVTSGGGTIRCTTAEQIPPGDDGIARATVRVDRFAPRTLTPAGHSTYPPDEAHADPTRVGPSATGGTLSLAYETASDAVVVTDQRSGRRTGSVKVPHEGPGVSAALLVDGRAVFADNHALYLLPVDASGRPGKLRSVPLPKAPGDRGEPQPDQNGTVLRDRLHSPQVLLLGGVAHIVFDQGAVTSVALPDS